MEQYTRIGLNKEDILRLCEFFGFYSIGKSKEQNKLEFVITDIENMTSIVVPGGIPPYYESPKPFFQIIHECSNKKPKFDEDVMPNHFSLLVYFNNMAYYFDPSRNNKDKKSYIYKKIKEKLEKDEICFCSIEGKPKKEKVSFKSIETQLQYDKYTCGVFVLEFMLRISGSFLDSIYGKRVDFIKFINYIEEQVSSMGDFMFLSQSSDVLNEFYKNVINKIEVQRANGLKKIESIYSEKLEEINKKYIDIKKEINNNPKYNNEKKQTEIKKVEESFILAKRKIDNKKNKYIEELNKKLNGYLESIIFRLHSVANKLKKENEKEERDASAKKCEDFIGLLKTNYKEKCGEDLDIIPEEKTIKEKHFELLSVLRKSTTDFKRNTEQHMKKQKKR